MSNLEQLISEWLRFRCYRTEQERVSIETWKYLKPRWWDWIKFFRNNDIWVVHKNLIIDWDLEKINNQLKNFNWTDVLWFLREINAIDWWQTQMELDTSDLEKVIESTIEIFLSKYTIETISTYCSNHSLQWTYKDWKLSIKWILTEVESLIDTVKEPWAVDSEWNFTFLNKQ